jgi:nicotinate-nucleotide adenylyltransferase
VTEPGQPRRIGVLGGTFDPVHNGHLYIANALRSALDLERLVWVPAGRPPHKTGQIVSSDRDRLAMLDLALSGSAVDQISTIDIERSGPSYTADTLEDSLRDLPTWHDPERLLRTAELAVAARPGVAADLAAVARHIPTVQGRVHLIPTKEIAISSSEIRRRVRENLSIRGLVPAAVKAYIRDHGLYRRQTP